MSAKKELIESYLDVCSLTQRYNLLWYMRNFGGLDPWQGQGRILLALKRRHNISQKELGIMLNLRPQSLGELLQKLEDNGYIKRRHSAIDKRALIVEMTEKGEAFQLNKPDYDIVVSDLNSREREIVQKAMEKIALRLKEQIKKEMDEYYF